MSNNNAVTITARLRDQLTGPAKKAEKAVDDLGKTVEKTGKDAEKSYDKAGKAAEDHARRTQQSTSKVERALDDLSGSTRRVGQVWDKTWRETEKGPQRAARALSTAGTQMVAESRTIGRKVGDNISQGIQSGIDNIDVSGVTAALSGLTVGGGVFAALDRDTQARTVAASIGGDPAAVRDLTESVYTDNYGADYATTSAGALAVIGTLELEPGSPEAEALLRGNLTMADAFGLDSERLALGVNIMADVDGVSFGNAQEQIAAALQKAAPGARDEVLDNLLEYAPLLNDTGISAGVLATLLSRASGRGPMASDKTGDLMKEWGVRLATQDTASVAAYESLGLDPMELSRRLQSGDATAFTDVAAALSQVEDQAEQARLAVDIYGAPLEDLGVGNIDDQIDAWSLLDLTASGAGDVLAGMQETMTEGPGANWSSAMRDMTQAMTDVGDAAAPFVSLAADIISVLAKPIAWGAGALTMYGILQRIPGTTDLGKKSLGRLTGSFRGLGGVLRGHPLFTVATAVWGIGEAFGYAYEQSELFRGVVDGINGGLADLKEQGFREGDMIGDAVKDKAPWASGYVDWATKTRDDVFGDTPFLANPFAHMLGEALGTNDWARENHWMQPKGEMPAHALGGWTGSGAHAAVVGEEGREFVVNHWASEKINRAHPGALGEINRGRLPAVPVAAPAAGLPPIGELHVHNPEGLDGAAFARKFAAHYQSARSREARETRLTNSTLTARGAR